MNVPVFGTSSIAWSNPQYSVGVNTVTVQHSASTGTEYITNFESTLYRAGIAVTRNYSKTGSNSALSTINGQKFQNRFAVNTLQDRAYQMF